MECIICATCTHIGPFAKAIEHSGGQGALLIVRFMTGDEAPPSPL